MIRVDSPSKAWIKRTIRPIYGWTQATPKATFLDPDYDRSTDPDIWPGMAMMRTTGDAVTVLDNTGHPYGLSALYVGGDGIDEVEPTGLNVFSVWVFGPDAEFEVMTPAFDPDVSWSDPGDGTNVLVHAWTVGDDRGKLAPAGASKADHTLSTRPIARLLKVNADDKITVGGLVGTTG